MFCFPVSSRPLLIFYSLSLSTMQIIDEHSVSPLKAAHLGENQSQNETDGLDLRSFDFAFSNTSLPITPRTPIHDQFRRSRNSQAIEEVKDAFQSESIYLPSSESTATSKHGSEGRLSSQTLLNQIPHAQPSVFKERDLEIQNVMPHERRPKHPPDHLAVLPQIEGWRLWVLIAV